MCKVLLMGNKALLNFHSLVKWSTPCLLQLLHWNVLLWETRVPFWVIAFMLSGIIENVRIHYKTMRCKRWQWYLIRKNFAEEVSGLIHIRKWRISVISVKIATGCKLTPTSVSCLMKFASMYVVPIRFSRRKRWIFYEIEWNAKWNTFFNLQLNACRDTQGLVGKRCPGFFWA